MLKRSLAVLVIFSVILMGFIELDRDNLYSYQWGLKNSGNFMVDRGILSSNHQIITYLKDFTDQIFYDDKTLIDFCKTDPNIGIAYANENFDMGWEKGYQIYKAVSHKRETIVAIIDTGIDINHEELRDNIWTNSDEIPDNGIDDDNNGYIDDYHGYNFINGNANVYVSADEDIHGTHAAGTIIAKHNNGGIKGLANDESIKVMPLKILGENGKGYMSKLVEAIHYAHNNGANICNISLGAYSYDYTLDDVIKMYPDMLFVVAAGNGANYIGYSLDEKTVYPAKLGYDNVICVSNACFDSMRYVSANYGSYVDVFAPGTFIISTIPGNSYGFLTGTSMAAPFVSAVAALIHSAYPNVPINQYKNVMVNGSTTYKNFNKLSKNGGLLNVTSTMMIASMF